EAGPGGQRRRARAATQAHGAGPTRSRAGGFASQSRRSPPSRGRSARSLPTAARAATASRNRAATPERKTNSEFAFPHPLSLFTFPPSAGARSVLAERFPKGQAVPGGSSIVHLRELAPWLGALVISYVFAIPGAIRAVGRA